MEKERQGEARYPKGGPRRLVQDWKSETDLPESRECTTSVSKVGTSSPREFSSNCILFFPQCVCVCAFMFK